MAGMAGIRAAGPGPRRFDLQADMASVALRAGASQPAKSLAGAGHVTAADMTYFAEITSFVHQGKKRRG